VSGSGARRWVGGNKVTLLENGEVFFPRLFEAVGQARREVIIETFILAEDEVGEALQEALCHAAQRGVKVDLLIDGFGSAALSSAFLERLTEAGVKVRVFDPAPRLLGRPLNAFRRMHRKLAVIDGALAFVGGINYCADHLCAFGPKAKQDYAVELAGPVVAEIHRFVLHAIAVGGKGTAWFRRRLKATPQELPAPEGSAEVEFVTRDNRRHTNDIERRYLAAIRSARQRIVIANAYFFPGYRLIQEMRRAAGRGVDVRLILQGEPDLPIAKVAASMLYHHLLHAGVRIHEYCERPLHGKVALVDDRWSTVGSSNLDPLSLSLNLEANVIVRDAAFNQLLSQRLDHLIQHGCRQVQAGDLREWSGWRLVRSFFVFHLLRWYPAWAGRLPRHAPRLQRLQPGEAPAPRGRGSTRTDAA
jgi:cardiolipin synthase A/B